jgi:hypothetical protein
MSRCQREDAQRMHVDLDWAASGSNTFLPGPYVTWLVWLGKHGHVVHVIHCGAPVHQGRGCDRTCSGSTMTALSTSLRMSGNG